MASAFNWLPTADEVAAGIPRALTAREMLLIDVLIMDAFTLLTAKVCNLSAITDNADKAATAKLIVSSAVRRVMRNPQAMQGFAAESEGGYSYSITTPLDASGSVWIPDSDVALLVGEQHHTRGTIRVGLMRRV